MRTRPAQRSQPTPLKLTPLPSWPNQSTPANGFVLSVCFCQVVFSFFPPCVLPSHCSFRSPYPRWPIAMPPAPRGSTELLRAGSGPSSARPGGRVITPNPNLVAQHYTHTHPFAGLSQYPWREVSPFKSAHNLQTPQQMKGIMCYILKSCKSLFHSSQA